MTLKGQINQLRILGWILLEETANSMSGTM